MPIERTANDRRMFGLLREIRAGARYLQNALEDVLQQASQRAAGDRDDFLREALNPALPERVDGIITRCLAEIRGMFAADVAEHEWGAGDITTIELTWNSVKDLWPPPQNIL